MTETRPIQLDDNLQRTFDRHPGAVRVFLDRRMACPGCDMAPFETVAEAARIYGVDAEELLTELRAT